MAYGGHFLSPLWLLNGPATRPELLLLLSELLGQSREAEVHRRRTELLAGLVGRKCGILMANSNYIFGLIGIYW